MQLFPPPWIRVSQTAMRPPPAASSSCPEKGLDLKQVEYVVLDEADTLFAKNFQPQLDEIFAAATKPGLKKSVFSATITPEVCVEICLVFLLLICG